MHPAHLVGVQALAARVPGVLAEGAEHVQAVAALRAVVAVLNAHGLTAGAVHHILQQQQQVVVEIAKSH
jgi:hypothetical protein